MFFQGLLLLGYLWAHFLASRLPLWLATALPLVMDVEQGVSARAVECAREAIVDGLTAWHADVKRREKAAAAAAAGGGGRRRPDDDNGDDARVPR